MNEGQCFHNFALNIVKVPHIAANILMNLEARDVANCLKASKDFRSFVSSAISWSKQLRCQLEEKVSKITVTSGTVDTKIIDTMALDIDRSDSPRDRFGFGIDGTFWLCVPVAKGGEAIWDSKSNKLEHIDPVGLNIYDLERGMKTRTMFINYNSLAEGRPKARILSDSRILIQDAKKVMLFEPRIEDDGLTRTYHRHSEKSHKCRLFNPKGDLFDADCMFDYVTSEEDGRGKEFTFYKDGGKSSLSQSVGRVKCTPKTVLQKVTYTLIF